MSGMDSLGAQRPRASRRKRTFALAALLGASVYLGVSLASLTPLLSYGGAAPGIFLTEIRPQLAKGLTHPWAGFESVPEPGDAVILALPDDLLRIEALIAGDAGAAAEPAPEAANEPELSEPAGVAIEAPSAPPLAAAITAAPVTSAQTNVAAPQPSAPPPSPPQAAVQAAPATPTARPAAPPPPPPTATPRPPAPLPPAGGLSAMEQQLFDGQNSERTRGGLPALRLDGALQSVARQRANDMATRGYFSHTSPTGQTAFTLIDAAGIYAPYAAENIGYNTYPDSQSTAQVLAAFMASPGHRANIMNGSYTRVGVAVAISSSGMKYFAVVFAGP